MTLKSYLQGAVLGAALAFGCGPKDGFSGDEREEQTLEVRVQRDVTDKNGQAFDGAQEILVRDEGTPAANEEVTLYEVISQGDVYLTEANGGGIALFPDSRRRHGAGAGRELNVNQPQQVQGSSETLLSGLLRWSLADFNCVSAESVPANGVPRVIIYSDENGRQVAFGGDYSRLQFDEPHLFYSFDPVGEGVPLIIPDEMAQAVFNESLYERIRRECRGSSSASCSGEVLFEDEFEGKELDGSLWETNLVNNGEGVLRYNDGILEIPTGQGGTSILQSRSRYSLADGPLCFEARWRVREREGITFGAGLTGEEGFITCDVSLKGNAGCWNYISSGEPIDLPSNINPTDWHTYRFEATRERVDYYVDEEHVGMTNRKIPMKSELLIDISCSSEDDREKRCDVDYVNLTR